MISVIIPTYNEEKNIEKCLKSLLKQSLPRKEYEIIVVDGKSKDKTVKIAKKYADKVIQQKSKGVGGARNDGVKLAKFELIATTDADCTLPENWLEKIKQGFENEVILVTGNMKFVGYDFYENVLSALIRSPLKIIYGSNLLMPCPGPNMAFRKKEFLKIGGFKDIPVLDDFEIYTRLRKEGKCRYNPKIVVSTSARRMKKAGIVKTHYLWATTGMRLLLGAKVKQIDYAKQDYD